MSNRDALVDFYAGSIICVTGGVGSVGSEISRQLQCYDVKELRVIDNNETELFEFEQRYSSDNRVKVFHADVTSEWEVMRAFSGVDYVFHAAALKHVPSCEKSPFSAIDTNIIGIKNIISSALLNSVKKVLFTSSDKAVNPTNVMGASKLLGERLFSATNYSSIGPATGTIFTSTRFGNVVGSRGSVVPLFCRQIAAGGPLTLTSSRMSRFMMTIEESANMVIETMMHARGGETFVTKMPVIDIADIAHVMIEILAPLYGYNDSDIEVKIIGGRPGEKLWEELSSHEESNRILEGNRYLCVLPAMVSIPDDIEDQYRSLGLKRSNCVYNSDNESRLTRSEVRKFLLQDGVLPPDVSAILARCKDR